MDTKTRRKISQRLATLRSSILIVLLLALGTTSIGCVSASTTPIQVSLAPEAQIFAQNIPVHGLALNLVAGAQDEVYGLDVGFFNRTHRKLKGIGAGIFNFGDGDVSGLVIGFANTADKVLEGLQIGTANRSSGEMKGIQIGTANTAKSCHGVQIGIALNKADSRGCVQVGIINVNPKGFLPVFPGLLIAF